MIQTIKWAWQRVCRGHDERLHWSLAEYLDPLVVAHVRFLRDHAVGHPSDMTQKKWNKVLDTILLGFREEPPFPSDKKAWGKYLKDRQKALVLLAFYWDSLWD